MVMIQEDTTIVDELDVKDFNGNKIGRIFNIPCEYSDFLEENTFDIDVSIKVEALINLIREGAIPSEIDFAELPD